MENKVSKKPVPVELGDAALENISGGLPGFPLAADPVLVKCEKCGRILDEGVAICPDCGVSSS